MYKNKSETETGYSLKTLHSDRGGEYLNTLFNEELRKNGIIHQLTNPQTPEQNGVTECLNQTLIEMVLALLMESGLPKPFWGEALCTAIYIWNCVLMCSVADKTPLEAWFGVKPSVKHFRVWGSCYVLHDHHSWDKLDPRSHLCVFIGYSKESKGYHVFDPSAKAPHFIITTQNVVFLENKKVDEHILSAVPTQAHPMGLELIPFNVLKDDMAITPVTAQEFPTPDAHPAPISASAINPIHRSACIPQPVSHYGNWDYNFNAASCMIEVNDYYTDPSFFAQAMASD